MDMRISGFGVISAGEYDDVSVSGSGKSEGLIRCKSFRCSGSFSGKSDFVCEGDFRTSGAFGNTGSIKAGEFEVAGSAKNDGPVTADSLEVSGAFSAKGSLKGNEVRISGAVRVKGDIEGEQVYISGSVDCDGLINAGQLRVRLASGGESRAASIGGESIRIESRAGGRVTVINLGRMFKAHRGSFVVSESIEGDEIVIESTCAKVVRGRNVKIGEGCEIELVQYTGEAEISPDAKVGRVEKL